jgi:hypothetical protein
MHAQRAHADYLVLERDAYYLLILFPHAKLSRGQELLPGG